MGTGRYVGNERQRAIALIIGWERGEGIISLRPINDLPIFMQFGKPHIILGKRPQLSLLTHHHICANKHNTLRKIAKNVNDLNVGYFLKKTLYSAFKLFQRLRPQLFEIILKIEINYPVIWNLITAFRFKGVKTEPKVKLFFLYPYIDCQLLLFHLCPETNIEYNLIIDTRRPEVPASMGYLI